MGLKIVICRIDLVVLINSMNFHINNK